MKRDRTERAAELEQWAEDVDEHDLVVVDTDVLRVVAEIAAERERVESELADAIHAARRNGRSWSEIGMMLGVSKQAAQRKYAKVAS